MKRALMVCLLLCSALLLLTERTRAQEILPVGGEYSQNVESTVVVEQDVEEDPLIESQTANSTVDKLADLETLIVGDNVNGVNLPNENTIETITFVEKNDNLAIGITSDSETVQTSDILVMLKERPELNDEAVRVENAETNNIEVVEQAQGGWVGVQSQESLSEEILQPDSKLQGITDEEISRSDVSKNEAEFGRASSEGSSQSNDSETEAELENQILVKLTKVEAGKVSALESSQSDAEIIGNAVITATVPAEDSEPAYTTLVDVEVSTENPVEETEVSTSQSEIVVTEASMENNTESDTEKTTELENVNADTTKTTPVATTESPCTESGTYAVENDCRAYISCTPTAAKQLIRAQNLCPIGQAYSPELRRCSRDISPCADAFHCEVEGTFADPLDNTFYYWCVASRLTVTYHIYHIKCGNGQIFTHELGKCFVDMTNLQDLPLNYELYMSKSPDEECVREEVKMLKAEEKAKLKEAKLREKIRKKYEKELMKKAAKQAKEQAKLQGISLEDETPFDCVEEGSFAAAPESFFDYHICQSKKGKFKAIGMKCADGQSFSTTQYICTL